MKKDELIRFYSSTRASESFKEDIFSVCTGEKVRITHSKRKSFSGMICAAAVFAAVICAGVFVITNNNDDIISPVSEINEPVDIIDESDFVFSQEEKKELEEYISSETEGSVSEILAVPYQSFIWPCPTVRHITDKYAERIITEENNAVDFHKGIDIAQPDCEGEPVVASASGTVTKASDTDNGYGIHVIIDHGNNIATLYGHMSESCVSEGDEVEQGQTIGYIGSSGFAYGDHCHFEVRVNYETVDPLKYVTIPEE